LTRADNKSGHYGTKISTDKAKQVPGSTFLCRRTGIFQYTICKTPSGVLDLFATVKEILNVVLLITNFLTTVSGAHSL
jgi:hypothetical protein